MAFHHGYGIISFAVVTSVAVSRSHNSGCGNVCALIGEMHATKKEKCYTMAFHKNTIF